MIYSIFGPTWVGEIEAPDEEEALRLFRVVTGDIFEGQNLEARPRTDRRKAPHKNSQLR